jgi:Glycosyl transferase family 2
VRVSVCVPAFERPEMLAQLIHSFATQDHEDRELCISDDSRTDGVEQMVGQLSVPGVVYRRNPVNLGFAHNLRAALSMASGEVIVVLGDDDLLAGPAALSTYSAVFEAAPGAAFAYPNLVQVDATLHVTLLYRQFARDIVYRAGSDAVEHLLLRSILITGIGLRRTPEVQELFPSENMLFPQVELVGRLLVDGEGIGIGSFLCATRAHAGQLGFEAIQGRGTKGGEQHGGIEVMDITRALIRYDPSLRAVRPSIDRQLTRAFTTNVVNEKCVTGNRAMVRNAYQLVRNTRVTGATGALVLVTAAVALLPVRVAMAIKEAVRTGVVGRQIGRSDVDVALLSDFWEPRSTSGDSHH